MSKGPTKAELVARVKELEGLTSPDANKELLQWREIGEKYHQIADRSELCEDGNELLDNVEILLGKKKFVNYSVNFKFSLSDFELPPGAKEEDRHNYRITIKDKDGNIIEEDFSPDEVEVD